MKRLYRTIIPQPRLFIYYLVIYQCLHQFLLVAFTRNFPHCVALLSSWIVSNTCAKFIWTVKFAYTQKDDEEYKKTSQEGRRIKVIDQVHQTMAQFPNYNCTLRVLHYHGDELAIFGFLKTAEEE